MTKKHFIKIAAAFKHRLNDGRMETPEDTLEHLALDLCGVFAEVNPNFDKQRFMNACGF